MSTNANIKSFEGGHWYHADGKPCHEVLKADGSGMTKTTLRHAKKMNLLPSVTTILRILDKPALTVWKVEQAVLAVMTTPRQAGEADDAFIKRVLSVDKEQDSERDAAAQLGTDIHDAIESALSGKPYQDELKDFVLPVLEAVKQFGKLVGSELCVIGSGYAGKLDAHFTSDTCDTVVDFKTTKKLPKESYAEHKLQLAAYAHAVKAQCTANIYISTVERGKIAVCINDSIESTHADFCNLVNVWQWISGFVPNQITTLNRKLG